MQEFFFLLFIYKIDKAPTLSHLDQFSSSFQDFP